MPKQINPDKTSELERAGTFNKKYQHVLDELFEASEFFDPQDLVQVKYEMLRRVQKDKWSVTKVAEIFGFSRFVYYDALAHFQAGGFAGLLPRKKGPKHSHKLNNEILPVINDLIEQQGLNAEQLAEIVQHRFAVDIHPGSIGRAIARWKKKR